MKEQLMEGYWDMIEEVTRWEYSDGQVSAADGWAAARALNKLLKDAGHAGWRAWHLETRRGWWSGRTTHDVRFVRQAVV